MPLKNVQISIDQETLAEVDRVGKSLSLKRSEVVRQALREWLRQRFITRFEEDWIALRKRPDQADDADDWLGVQTWSKTRVTRSW